MTDPVALREFVPFRFVVTLYPEGGSTKNPLCAGAFSEVTGFEFTMTPKTIQEGGRNWGEVQLAGTTKFAPITLKRGITSLADLYQWFDVSSRQANYALRLTGQIDVFDCPLDSSNKNAVKPVLSWRLTRALAVKFKGPDLSATASQVAVEELQLVHEGLELVVAQKGSGT
jgi:phage tail-like protein